MTQRRPIKPGSTKLVLAPSSGRALVLTNSGLGAGTAETLADLADAGRSRNTQAAYASAMRYWHDWHRLRYAAELDTPVPLAVLLTFLADHASVGRRPADTVDVLEELEALGRRRSAKAIWSLSTLRLHFAALTRWQGQLAPEGAQWVTPTQHPQIRQLLQLVSNAYAKRGQRTRQKSAATLDALEAMLGTCEADLVAAPLPTERAQRQRELVAVRDAALLRFGWSSGGRRRSEIAGAVLENLTRHPPRRAGEPALYSYRLGVTKTNQDGRRMVPDKPVVGAAARDLERWLAAAGITEGPLFRAVTQGAVREALSDRTVARIVQRRAALAGLEGDWGGHSLRSGFVTEANNQGVPIAETMAHTDHRTPAMIAHYHQAGALLHSAAGRLADRKGHGA